MSGYRGRGVNVSHFLANGNTIPSPNEVNAEDHGLNFDDELAKFTNIDFTIEHDGGLFDGNSHNIDFTLPLSQQEHPEKRQKIEGNERDLNNGGEDFVNGDFAFDPSNPFSIPTSPANGLVGATDFTQPSFPSHYAGPHPIQTTTSPTSVGHYAAPYTSGGNKRTATSPATSSTTTTHLPTGGHPAEESESARLAADEDKRRRNTAASARFRVKKKEREKKVEKEAEDLRKKNSELETQVEQLKHENAWLKDLVVRGRDAGGGAGAGKDTVTATAVNAKMVKDEQGLDARSTGGKNEDGRIDGKAKKGVGTTTAAVVAEEK